MYTSLHPVQPAHQPKNHYYMNVPQNTGPVPPPRGSRGMPPGAERHRNVKHQQNCPCCKVKLLSTIHGHPCGSNARPYSPNTPDPNSRPISPDRGTSMMPGEPNSRPVSPDSSLRSVKSNNSRSHSPRSVLELSPGKSSVHSHPNCKCDINSARKVDSTNTGTLAQKNVPKRRAPTPPARKPTTKLCSSGTLQSKPVGSNCVQLQNNLSECVV